MNTDQLEIANQNPSIAAEVVYRVTRNFAACSWENSFVIVWRAKTLAADAHEIREFLRDFARRFPQGYFLLTVVQETAPLPDAAAREAIASYLKDGADHIVAGAVVLTGGLLRVTFVRAVATGLKLLAGQPFPFRVCSLEHAVQLFVTHGRRCSIPFRADEFLRGLQRLRKRINDEVPLEPSGTRANLNLF